MKRANYKISGRIEPAVLRKVPEGLVPRVYAVRDRSLLGSSLLEKDGSFNIEYEYEIYETREERLAIGPYLIVGPDLPGDAILGQKFPQVFLSPEEFEDKEGEWCGSVSPEVIVRAIDETIITEKWFDWQKTYCYEWRPCVQVLACSKIASGLCYDEKPLENARVRIYEVRWPMITMLGTQPHEYDELVAEGDTDTHGYFRPQITICKQSYMIPFYKTLGYRVEVVQIINGAFNSVYKDPQSLCRVLKTDLCEEIYIQEHQIIVPQSPDGLLPGSTFKLTRIGNIPVGYINQDTKSPFYGYANSMNASGSAILKVVDSAFYGTIKLFANIGSGLVNTVAYYRIKYKVEGTDIENYIQIPFNNLRESTSMEKSTSGPYKTESMGPIDGNIYVYPNPYDSALDKQWVYKGLIMELDTTALPLSYGRYRFTVELLDSNEDSVSVSNPDDLTCTILVDNTGPTGAIQDIIGPAGQQVSACGFLELPLSSTETRTCNGNIYTRNVVIGKITAPFRAYDQHGNLKEIELQARFGDPKCDKPLSLYQEHYPYVSPPQNPIWNGGNYSPVRNGKWDECAYQFKLTIYKRVTNGEVVYPWWSFDKLVTIVQA